MSESMAERDEWGNLHYVAHAVEDLAAKALEDRNTGANAADADRAVASFMMDSVPNKPKTPLRNVRIDDELWGNAKIIAAAKGETVSDVIRAGLEEYVDDNRGLL